MSLNTFILSGDANNAGVSVMETQGIFCFYKSASPGTTNTDVRVFANNNLVAVMSPTEHFRLDRKWNQLRFEAAEVANKATFITADSTEDYGTSQVAGDVVVTGGTITIDGTVPVAPVGTFPVSLADTPGDARSKSASSLIVFYEAVSVAGTACTMNVHFTNGTPGKSIAIQKLSFRTSAANFYMGLYDITGTTMPPVGFATSRNKLLGGAVPAGRLDPNASGLYTVGPLFHILDADQTIVEFDDPIILTLNKGLRFLGQADAVAGVVGNLTICIEGYEF